LFSVVAIKTLTFHKVM